MSLIAWYPLNGDCKNQGLSQEDASWVGGDNYVDNGKIGKCAKFSAGKYITGNIETTNTSNFSFSFWINISSQLSTLNTYYKVFQLPVAGTSPAIVYLPPRPTLKIFDATSYFMFEHQLNGTYDTWQHLCVTVEQDGLKSKGKLYINGNLITTHNCPNTITLTQGQVKIGEGIATGYVLLNDVRIYNTCISQKEVNEISKALILHYPLNQIDGVIGGRNLLQPYIGEGASTQVIDSHQIMVGTQAYDTYFYLKAYVPLLTSKTYTLSCKAENVPENLNWVFGVMSQNSGKNLYITHNGINSITFSPIRDFAIGEEIILDDYTNRPLTAPNIILSDFKLEEGEIATPYTPAPEEYASFEFDGIIQDVSGFGNNGTVTATTCPTWSNENVIGQGSYRFSNGAYIVGPKAVETMPKDALTIACWAYRDTWDNGGPFISCTHGAGFSLACSQNKIWSYIMLNPGYQIPQSNITPQQLTPGWHHFSATCDERYTKLYVDGLLHGEVDAGSLYSITYHPNNSLIIGAESGGSPGVIENAPFEGNLSDVRVYATCLSADAIKELYQTRYSIADDGTIFCDAVQENLEIDSTNLIFNGDLKFVEGTVAKGFEKQYNPTYGGITGGWDGFGCQTKVSLTPGCRYEYSFDYYIVSWTKSNAFFMAIKAFDNTDSEIPITQTNRYGKDGDTTLASPLNNGDTTATIIINNNINVAWNTYAVHQYSHFNIFNNVAYGYNRATYTGPHITQYSNGVVTFETPWQGGNFPQGTKVGICYDGSTYIYPAVLNQAQNYVGQWQTISGTFICDSRYSMRYALPWSLNYGQEVYFRNIKIENITETQHLSLDNYRDVNVSNDCNVKFTQNGQLIANSFCEKEGLDIRYIRDYLNGNTINNDNHWCEIQAFNDAENNCCWGIIPTSSSPVLLNPDRITDGNTSSYLYSQSHSGTQYVQIDLCKARKINKLKIWHYWGDARSYNNKTQVSADGVNWITVFDSATEGTYVETEGGHTIDLTDNKFGIYSNGVLKATQIIES